MIGCRINDGRNGREMRSRQEERGRGGKRDGNREGEGGEGIDDSTLNSCGDDANSFGEGELRNTIREKVTGDHLKVRIFEKCNEIPFACGHDAEKQFGPYENVGLRGRGQNSVSDAYG